MEVREIKVKGALSKTSLPGLDYSLNPYRGCMHGCVYCLHPDTIVLTRGGFVKIRDVQTSIVSHVGRFCETNNRFEHYYCGKMINLKPLYFKNLRLTPDHKILSVKRDELACRIRPRTMCLPDRRKIFLRRGRWVDCKECSARRKPRTVWTRAIDLQKGDFIVVPIPMEIRDIQFLHVSEILSEHRQKHKKNKNRKLSPEKIKKIFELRSKGFSHRKIAKELGIAHSTVKAYLHGRSKDLRYEIGIVKRGENVKFKGGKTEIPNEIAVDNDFLRLVGYYLAEGCVSASSRRPNSAYIAFTFNEDEREYISDTTNLLKKIFKIEPSILHIPKDKSVRISSGANILAFLFAALFGKKSEEMRIPAEFLYLPLEKQKELMKGLLRGDGGLSSPKWLIYGTTSRNLLNSARLILLRLGIICSTQVFRKGQKRRHIAFALSPAWQFRQRFVNLFGVRGEFSNPRNLRSGIYEENGHKYALVPIKSKKMEDYSGLVYNLSVEKDNSYIANFVAVSNCYSPAVLREPRPWGQFVDAKINAAEVLKEEIKKKPRGMIGIGTVTDAYQPIEAKYRITRGCLEILLEEDWPISIQTKSSLVMRDLDLIKQFSYRDVGFTITCIDDSLRRIFEPNSSPVEERLAALRRLHVEGIETWVFIGPILPLVTEKGLERLIGRIAESGARHVIFDRLNLKPGIWPRMQAAIKGRFDLFAEFKANVRFGDYFRKIGEQIQQLCESRGILCEPAFGRFPGRAEG